MTGKHQVKLNLDDEHMALLDTLRLIPQPDGTTKMVSRNAVMEAALRTLRAARKPDESVTVAQGEAAHSPGDGQVDLESWLDEQVAKAVMNETSIKASDQS
jgi:hypothetical protein